MSSRSVREVSRAGRGNEVFNPTDPKVIVSETFVNSWFNFLQPFEDFDVTSAMEWAATGIRIRDARTALGLTQLQLGQQVGTSKNDVTQTEGGRPVSEEKLERYARALGVSRPFLRYGIAAGATDTTTIERRAYQRGVQDGLEKARDQIASLTADDVQATRDLTYAAPKFRSRVAESATRLNDAIAKEAPAEELKRLGLELEDAIEGGLAQTKADKREVARVKEHLIALLAPEYPLISKQRRASKAG